MNTGCGDFTPASLAADYTAQTGAVAAQLPSIAPAVSVRNHCIVFSDWSTQPKTALQNGIRLDTNYYYWPPGWVNDRPGHFTGSGMPMRFADLDGSMIDVYQAATQMTDESGQSYPLHSDVLLDNAVGAEGLLRRHDDEHAHRRREPRLAAGDRRLGAGAQRPGRLRPAAARRGSTAATARRSRTCRGRATRCRSRSPSARARTAFARWCRRSPRSARSAGSPAAASAVTTVTRTIKGVEYAFFNAAAGAYVASYAADTTAPAITGVDAAAADDGTATIGWTTNEPATSRVEYGLSPAC